MSEASIMLLSFGSYQQLQDLIPFFTCLGENLLSAQDSLFPSVNAPASRFTPSLFLFYFRIFETATAPKITVSHPDQFSHSGASWEPIKGETLIILRYLFQCKVSNSVLSAGAEPLRRVELVRFALRAQSYCPAVYTDVSTQTLTLLMLTAYHHVPVLTVITWPYSFYNLLYDCFKFSEFFVISCPGTIFRNY